jgi:hypothetical protein
MVVYDAWGAQGDPKLISGKVFVGLWASRAQHSALAMFCILYTARIMPTTCSLEHLQVAPFSSHPHECFITILMGWG